jgi:D-glycero-D-manno-heptose 1,7-bisphosphate phosphatase
MARRAAFIGRDGTLNRASAATYLRSTAEFAWQPGAIAGLALLAHAGFALVVVSNQQGVALGEVDPSILMDIEALIQTKLAEAGLAIRAFMYCVHHEDEGCGRRKPKPGMLRAAARTHDLDLSESWMLGDRSTDAAAGAAAGCRTVLLGNRTLPHADATLRCLSLLDAANHILDLQ